jgi:DNA-binding transcriptional LysR family regulator
MPPEGLVARRIAAVATALYASRPYLARHSGGELRRHDWVSPDDSLSHAASALWIAAAIPMDRIVHRASSLLVLRTAARAGLGMAALPCYQGDPDPLLRRVRGPIAEKAVSLWLITHPDLRKVARIRAVLDFVAKRLFDHRPLLEGAAPAD